jgi:hypothetical protein
MTMNGERSPAPLRAHAHWTRFDNLVDMDTFMTPSNPMWQIVSRR